MRSTLRSIDNKIGPQKIEIDITYRRQSYNYLKLSTNSQIILLYYLVVKSQVIKFMLLDHYTEKRSL